MKDKTYFTLFLLFSFLLSGFAVSVPFFWDSINFSEIAMFYYNNHFSELIAPAHSDVGNPPLYSLYMAFWWAMAGKTLVVSHFVFFPFLLGCFWEFYKLAKIFLPEQLIPYTLLLLAIEPTFITQSVLMSPDIMLIYFYLLAINAILQDKKWVYVIALCLLSMINLRGIIALFPLLITHLFLNTFFNKHLFCYKDILLYIPVFMLVSTWTIYHFYITEWSYVSPIVLEHRQNVSFIQMIRNMVYLFWKLFDFGRGGVFFFIGICFLKTFIISKQSIPTQLKQLVLITLIPLLVLSIVTIPFSNPFGHRYFLIIYLLTIIIAVYQLKYFSKKSYRILIFLVLSLALLSGNFWIYPERFGNGWDASLKCIPYFTLNKEMTSFIKKEQIAPQTIGTSYPLQFNHKYTELSNEDFAYVGLDNKPLKDFPYILHSNICNDFSVEQMDELQNQWTLIKEIKSGLVYMRLYKNPY